jgi:hypothetical protein
VDHRLPQILGRGAAARVILGDVAGSAVVHHYIRVIDGDVLDPLIEVSDRVTARVHHLADEPVRFCDGAFGIVDKARLNAPPLGPEPRGILWRQRSDVKAFHTFLPFLQLRFGFTDIADFANRALVLWTETAPQLFGLLPPHDEVPDHSGSDNGGDDDYPHGLAHRFVFLVACWCRFHTVAAAG